MDTQQKADFKIIKDGTWYHGGAEIKRAALAKLFSDRALKIDEEGRYWLQTPHEKYEVEVEDVPYIITDYTKDQQGIEFTTNMDEIIKLDANHPLELRDNIPYIEIRDGLYAKMGRSVYYNLVQECGITVSSYGQNFVLGEVSEAS